MSRRLTNLPERMPIRAAPSLLHRVIRRAGRSLRTVGETVDRRSPIHPPDDAEELVRGSRNALERILHTGVLSYWDDRVVDGAGGYHLDHDAHGRVRAAPTKHTIGQARTMWFFSRLARSPYARASDLDMARHGYRYLRDRLWDPADGGFLLTTPGPDQSDAKHGLAQCFGLLALSEYAQASGDAEPAALAHRLFELYDAVAFDPAAVGYREVFTRPWGTGRGPVEALPGQPDHRTINFHLHMLEALIALHDIGAGDLVRQRLADLIAVMTGPTLQPAAGGGVDAYRLDWTPIRERWNRPISYGHELERIWLVLDAESRVGNDLDRFEPLFLDLFRRTLRHGYDRKRGGFYHFGVPRRAATSRAKVWWVQAEALVATLRLFAWTGEPTAATAYLGTLDWIQEHQVDWSIGGWHHTIDERGRSMGFPKAQPAWKTPYHDGRAMLECLDTLEQL